jgi:hypothetical protein
MRGGVKLRHAGIPHNILVLIHIGHRYTLQLDRWNGDKLAVLAEIFPKLDVQMRELKVDHAQITKRFNL